MKIKQKDDMTSQFDPYHLNETMILSTYNDECPVIDRSRCQPLEHSKLQ